MEARSILSWGRSAPWGAFDERKKFLWGRSRKMQHREIEGMILMHDRSRLLQHFYTFTKEVLLKYLKI